MPPKSKAAKKSDIPSKASTTTKPQAEQQQRPAWPLITSLISAEDLSFTTLLQDQIFTISQLWTSTLCKAYIAFLSTLTFVTTPKNPKRGEAVRVNDRFQIEDPGFAEELWSRTALSQLITHPVLEGRRLTDQERNQLWGGEVLGLNSNIRIYRYSKGQFFDQHYDETNNVFFPSKAAPQAVPAKTTWTLLLYLSAPSTGCVGGETVFYPDPPSKKSPAPAPIIAELEVGKVLLHRHGTDCLLHEGREVTQGEKWVIRSDLCVKR